MMANKAHAPLPQGTAVVGKLLPRQELHVTPFAFEWGPMTRFWPVECGHELHTPL